MQISSSLRRPCSPYPQPPAIIRTPPPSPARASPPPGADRASIVLERGPMTPPSPINYSRDEDELTFNQNEEPDHGYNDTVRDLLGWIGWKWPAQRTTRPANMCQNIRTDTADKVQTKIFLRLVNVLHIISVHIPIYIWVPLFVH